MKKGQIVKQTTTVCLQKTAPIDTTPLLLDSLEFNFVAIKNPPDRGGLIPCYLCVYVIRPHFTAALMMRAEVLFAS